MALAPGTRFGPYEIGGPIGAGGMGEVYRATDTNLKRDVAIKVLPESFASDAGRLARFQREAEVLAALNHPNIAHIYGLEKSDGATALVMELVEGPTLADRIALGPLPAGDALNVAMQIADALEAAHGRGIVHRDLKPANVKLRPDGTVKVLDFGIAKALDASTGISGGTPAPQLTTPAMTQAGLILGTAAYMAPEQARGLPVDDRADVWAFGCVLYEMLTGQPAFGGEDVTITLARVVDRDTDLESLPTTISPAVRQTIALCLQKDVRRRVADIRDVRLALEGAFEAPSRLRAAGDSDGDAQPQRSRLVPLAAGLVAGSVLVGLVGVSLWPEPEPRPVNRFAIALPQGQAFSSTGLRTIDLSPDGRTLVYSGVSSLRLRDMGTLDDRAIPGLVLGGAEPTFSPDGRSVAFFTADPAIRRVATTGGAAVLVTNELSGTIPSLSWSSDGTMWYSDVAGIQRVPAAGGTPELVVRANDSLVYGPRLLPDGDTLLFTRFSLGTVNSGEIVTHSISTGEQAVVASGADGRYVPTGHIVYVFESTLFGIAFDAESRRARGAAVPLVEGLSSSPGVGGGSGHYAIADDGTLAYVRGLGGGGAANTLVWVDREGNAEPLAAPARVYQYLELSPDGTRVALDIRDQEGDAWVWDLARETLQRLTFDPGQNRGAIWSPDSRRIAFSRQLGDGEEIYWQAADGSGTAEALTDGSGQPMFPVEITPDGTTLLYTKSNLPRDIFMIPIEGPAGPGTPLIAGDASEGSPTVSPDGRWLAYSSDESGSYEVYVRPFPDVDSGRWQISVAGGVHPQWRPDGSELFYLSVDGPTVAMMAVPIESGSAFRPGSPTALFSGGYYYAATASGPDVYDVSADGQRFLMIAQRPADEPDARPDIVIVQNWFEELKRLVPVE